MKESDIQAQVRQVLTLCGWYVFRHHQSLGSHRGLSDLTAIKCGRTVWIEMKTPKGKLSAHQETFRDAVEAAGGEYRVVRCLEDIADLLNAREGSVC